MIFQFSVLGNVSVCSKRAGKDVLKPCTSLISMVRWKEEEKAEITFLKPFSLDANSFIVPSTLLSEVYVHCKVLVICSSIDRFRGYIDH